MMRSALGLILAATLVFGNGVHAAETSTAEAGETPADGVWYSADLFFEDVRQFVLGAVPSWKLSYIESRIREREAEAREMMDKKGLVSDELFVVLGKKMDHRLDAADIARSEGDKEKLRELEYRGHVADLEYLDRFSAEKGAIAKRKEELRKEIAEAREAGETSASARIADLVSELDKAAEQWNDLDRRYAAFAATNELAAEHVEHLMDPAVQAEMAASRALELAERSRKAWEKLLAALGLPQQEEKWTTQRLVDLMLENRKKPEDLQKTITQARRDARAEEYREEAAKDDAALNPPAPAPAPTPPPAPAPAPAPKPRPKRLTPIPSESVQTAPLQLIYYPTLTGQVGTFFSVKYDGKDGLPPYHFKLDSGVGFPPQGVILDPNGVLSGTPKAAGRFTFGVCVVDTAGNSVCANTVMTVNAAPPPPPPAPPPPPPQAGISIAITSTTCSSDGSSVIVSGSASGPENSRISIHYGDVYSCGSWTSTYYGCTRDAGQPEGTTWTFRYTAFTVSGDDQDITITSPSGESKTVYYQKNCR